MKKVLSLSIAALIILAMVAVGTWAYFSDTEQSTGNTFTAGTLNLKLTDADESDQNGVSASFSSDTFGPGDSVGPSTITLKNTGSLTADHADIKLEVAHTAYGSYDEADLGVAQVEDMSTVMTVDTLTYGGDNLLQQTVPGTFDNAIIEAADNAGNNDGVLQLSELNGVVLQDLTAPAADGGTKAFVITVSMDSSVGNEVQGDTVTVTITFGIYQDASQHLT